MSSEMSPLAVLLVVAAVLSRTSDAVEITISGLAPRNMTLDIPENLDINNGVDVTVAIIRDAGGGEVALTAYHPFLTARTGTETWSVDLAGPRKTQRTLCFKQGRMQNPPNNCYSI